MQATAMKTYPHEDPLAIEVDVGDGELVAERHFGLLKDLAKLVRFLVRLRWKKTKIAQLKLRYS